MLALLTRSTRAAHIPPLHARVLSTITHSAGSPNNSVPEQLSHEPTPDKTAATRPKQKQARLLRRSSAECMTVFTWNGIHSSAEGLAIARAVEDRYGRAKEVIFRRDVDNVSFFQPFFWLVYDDPNVRERLPEDDAQIKVHVPDIPKSYGDVGLEEMMRGLGLSTTDNKDTHHQSSPSPPTETKPSESSSDAPPEGYKTIDVRVEWAHTGPREFLLGKRRVNTFLPNRKLQPEFAKLWLAFDGFSHESARGPHTLNLFHAREKWRKVVALPASTAGSHYDNVISETAAGNPSSQEGGIENVVEETESGTEALTNKFFSREWLPIIPSAFHSQQRLGPTSSPSKNDPVDVTFNASTSASKPDNYLLNAAAEAADTTTADAIPTPTSAGEEEENTTKQARTGAAKLSRRRERILQLARQNARTPLPELPKKPQPPPPMGEKLDEESERQGKERTIRERLWRLVGGNYSSY